MSSDPVRLATVSRLAIAAALGFTVSDRAAAQNAPILLPEVSVTATRTERPLDATSKSVTVIDRETIDTRNASDVLTLLRDVPGLSLSRAGGLGGQISLRGFNSNDSRSPLFIDGDRFRGRNTLEYLLIDPSQIERIEVIRGPAAALYGTDSFSGLVNVITRRPQGNLDEPFHFTGGAVTGTASTNNALRGGVLEVEGVGSRIDLRASVSAKGADDYRSGDGRVSNSDFETRSTDVKLGWTPVPDQRVEVGFRYNWAERGRAGGIGAVPGAPLVELREEPIYETAGRLSYEGKFSESLFDKVAASLYARDLYTEINNKNRTVANRLTDSTSYVEGPLIIGGKLQGTVDWGAVDTTIGTDFYHEMRPGSQSSSRVTNYTAAGAVTSVTNTAKAQEVPDAEQTNIGLFLHNEWEALDRLTLSASGRYDWVHTKTDLAPLVDRRLLPAYQRNSDSEDSAATGALGAVWRAFDTVHFTANAANSFRAPATYELFGSGRQGTGFLVPNPDLKPETGMVYEVGTRLVLPRLHANLTALHSEYQDLIARVPVTYSGLPSQQRRNIGEATIDGVELDLKWSVAADWLLFGKAAWLRGTDDTNNRPLPYIAPFAGNVGVRYEPMDSGFFVEAVTRWASAKTRVDATQERQTDAYAVFDLYAGFELRKLISERLGGAKVVVGIENLFDTAYVEPTTTEDIRYPKSVSNPLQEYGRTMTVSLKMPF